MNAAFSGIRANFLPEFPRAAGNFAGVKEAPDCRILWSESMHDGLISNRRVRIANLLPCLGSIPRHAAAAAVNLVAGDGNRSAPAELLVEVDHFRALLKADDDVEIGALAAAERDRFLDVIGDAGALPRSVEDDAYRKRPLAEDRLIGAGDGNEILEVHRIDLGGRAALGDDDYVEDQSHCVAAVHALGVGLAQRTVEGHVVRAMLGSRAEHRGVGERPQDHRARTDFGRFGRRRRPDPTAPGDREKADQHRARRGARSPHRLSCVPSQNGLPPVDLQPHSQTSSVAAAVNGTGVRPVPWCEPSQKGWLALRPHAHQKYLLPASTLTPYGSFCAGMGSAIVSFLSQALLVSA